MLALGVIKHLNIIEHVTAGFDAGAVGFPSDALRLQQLEKAFHNRIVVTVTASISADDQVAGLEEALSVRACELAALVGVKLRHPPPLGFPPPLRLALPAYIERRFDSPVESSSGVLRTNF